MMGSQGQGGTGRSGYASLLSVGKKTNSCDLQATSIALWCLEAVETPLQKRTASSTASSDYLRRGAEHAEPGHLQTDNSLCFCFFFWSLENISESRTKIYILRSWSCLVFKGFVFTAQHL